MNQPIVDLTKFDNFEDASRAALAYLHQRLGFDLWMMTKVEGHDWIVLQAEDHGYNVEEGEVFRWFDSFCCKMVIGQGPRVAPRAQDIPQYASAPIAQQVPIGAYIGVPLTRKDGSLFGTLCAIDPNPKDESICNELPLIELLAKFLENTLDSDLKALEQARLLERSQKKAMTDALTGLFNRHGWDQHVADEEARAKRYGSPACVLIIDLDGLKQINDTKGHEQGDSIIKSTANCIRDVLRKNDVVARIGGDEFAILGIECDKAGCEAIFKNVTNALVSNGINASVGKALRSPKHGLIKAIAEADHAMYIAKTENKTLRSYA